MGKQRWNFGMNTRELKVMELTNYCKYYGVNKLTCTSSFNPGIIIQYMSANFRWFYILDELSLVIIKTKV